MAKEAFYLFKSPSVFDKANEITRRIMDPTYRAAYRYFFENNYTEKGFIKGAKQV